MILHGFPSSSFEYSYGAAIGLQQLGYDVILHDHVGFGFSDKPINGFGYSIHDHADIALAFYKTLDHVNPVVFIGHDMVCTVYTHVHMYVHICHLYMYVYHGTVCTDYSVTCSVTYKRFIKVYLTFLIPISC